MRTRWDLFCNVIDNYGDIGVAWRLARCLAAEHAIDVRLWVDDLRAFSRIWPCVDPAADEQSIAGVTVRAWRAPFGDAEPAEVVVEAFGCALPESYLDAMSRQPRAPVWINLEYLSAEPWVATHHRLPSPHPRLPLTKHFFFPGYTADTGGLLMEKTLDTERQAFLERQTAAYWQTLGLPSPAAGELRVSLFAYENPQLDALLDAWSTGETPVTCLVPEGRVIPQIAAWLSAPALPVGSEYRRGMLRLHVLPFTNQVDYDRLLWACDLNFVRGEDSCVRAQLAARPLVWHAYPQADHIHWAKIDALLDLYVAGLEPVVADAVRDLWRHWNGMSDCPDIAAAWSRWHRHRAVLVSHAIAWRKRLADAGSLADALVEFAENKLK